MNSFVGVLMAKKDLGFDIVYRGETRDWIEPGTYVFFQRVLPAAKGARRRLLAGSGIWRLVWVYSGGASERTEYLMSLRSNEPQLGGLHDDPDDFFLRGW